MSLCHAFPRAAPAPALSNPQCQKAAWVTLCPDSMANSRADPFSPSVVTNTHPLGHFS